MADLKDSMEAPPTTIEGHTHAIVFLYDNPRALKTKERGGDWLKDAHAHRASLLASETTSVLANYIRLLEFDAKSHSCSASDVNLNVLAIAAGLLWFHNGTLAAPFVGKVLGLVRLPVEWIWQLIIRLRCHLNSLGSFRRDLLGGLGQAGAKQLGTGIPIEPDDLSTAPIRLRPSNAWLSQPLL